MPMVQRIWNFLEIQRIMPIIDQVRLDGGYALNLNTETTYHRSHFPFARDISVVALNESLLALATIDTAYLDKIKNSSTLSMTGLIHSGTYAHIIIANNNTIILIPYVEYVHGVTDEETLIRTMYQAVENGQFRRFADFEEAFTYMGTLADR